MAGIKRHLMSWGTGGPGPAPSTGAATVVLESAGHLAATLGSDLVGPGSVVFAPGVADHAEDASGAVVVGYEGSLSEAGGECSLGSDFYLQIQNYGVSAYMSVVGPTLIRVADAMDLDAYRADAEQARRSGDFPDFLTNPVIQLADLPALGADRTGSGPRHRLYADGDGFLSTAPGGTRLGVLGEDTLEALEARWLPLDDLLPGIAAADRAGLGRYLAAVAAVRGLRARGLTGVRVSGFGGRFGTAAASVPPQEAADTTGARLPLLLRSGEETFVHDPASERTFTLAPAAAALAEVLLAAGSVEAASAHADRTGLEQVAASFAETGISLGTAAGAPARARAAHTGDLVTAGC